MEKKCEYLDWTMFSYMCQAHRSISFYLDESKMIEARKICDCDGCIEEIEKLRVIKIRERKQKIKSILS